MSNQYLSFDVTKQSAPQQLIIGRQGDSQLKFVSILFWDGEKNVPYDLTGKQVVFEALKPDGTHIVDSAGISILNATGGLARYAFNEQVFTSIGTMQQAFFKITQTDSSNNVITDSTLEISIKVLENKVEFGINSTDYLSEYDHLVAEVKKKFDDYAATVQDSIDKAQEIHDQIIEYTNLINASAVVTKAEFGDVSLIKQPVGVTVVDKINNEFGSRGVNVQWYGAKGDDATDDTQAFLDAMTFSFVTGSKIYVPSGKYVITKTLDLPTGVQIEGENHVNAMLRSIGAEVLINLNTNNAVKNISLSGYKETSDSILLNAGAFEGNIGKVTETSGGIIDNVYFSGSDTFKTQGIVIHPVGLDSNNVSHVFPNIFKNINMRNVWAGLTLIEDAFSWITGNVFENFTVMNFRKYGVSVTSVSPDAMGISRNKFTNYQVEAGISTLSDSAGLYMNAGLHNRFDFFHMWNDNGVRTDNIRIDVNPNYTTEPQTYLRDNFISGTVEGGIFIDDRLKPYNTDISDVEINDFFIQGAMKSRAGSMQGRYLPYKPLNIFAEDMLESDYISNVNNSSRAYQVIPLLTAGQASWRGRDARGAYLFMGGSAGKISVPVQSWQKQFLQNTLGSNITVVVDMEFDKGSLNDISITGDIFYDKGGIISKIPQKTTDGLANIMPNTYRYAMTYTPQTLDLTASNFNIQIGYTANTSQQMKIRRVYLIIGDLDVNQKIYESHKSTKQSVTLRAETAVTDEATMGLYMPNKLLVNPKEDYLFHTALVTTSQTFGKSDGYNYVTHEYPFYF